MIFLAYFIVLFIAVEKSKQSTGHGKWQDMCRPGEILHTQLMNIHRQLAQGLRKTFAATGWPNRWIQKLICEYWLWMYVAFQFQLWSQIFRYPIFFDSM